jgi:hypothetical protein
MWSFGPHNSSHFIKNQSRELLFREALIVFVGAGETKQERLADAYCQSCKQANKDIDCSKCNRQVEVIEDVKSKLGNKSAYPSNTIGLSGGDS